MMSNSAAPAAVRYRARIVAARSGNASCACGATLNRSSVSWGPTRIVGALGWRKRGDSERERSRGKPYTAFKTSQISFGATVWRGLNSYLRLRAKAS
jgi:hypothetical protein